MALPLSSSLYSPKCLEDSAKFVFTEIQAGLVTAQKCGKWVYYECIIEGLTEVIEYLDRFRHPATANLF